MMETLPEGAAKDAERQRIRALDEQIGEMRKLVMQLPEPPKEVLAPGAQRIPPEPASAVAASPPPEPSSSSVWIGWGFGLVLGAFIAFAFAFRTLPGRLPPGAMRMPQLAVIAALLAAVGPQLQALNYDQLPIILLWVLLSVGAVIRLGMRRVRSQIELFSLDRISAEHQEDEDE